MSGVTITYVEGLLMDSLGGSPLENTVAHVVLALLYESAGQHEVARMAATKSNDLYQLHMGTLLENSKNEVDKTQYE